MSFLRGIFVRIGEQIAENLCHPVGVTEHYGGFLRQMQGEHLSLSVPAWLKGGHQLANEEVDIEGGTVQFHLAGFHAREIQQVIGDAQQPASIVLRNSQKFPLHLG